METERKKLSKAELDKETERERERESTNNAKSFSGTSAEHPGLDRPDSPD